jgi:hypothetical protein
MTRNSGERFTASNTNIHQEEENDHERQTRLLIRNIEACFPDLDF